MNRIIKLLGIILIFGIVFFIICDERGFKIEIKNNHIYFVEKQKKIEQENYTPKYKNANLIRINPSFKYPWTLRMSSGMNEEYLAKNEAKYPTPKLVSIDDEETIFGVFDYEEKENEKEVVNNIETSQNSNNENDKTSNTKVDNNVQSKTETNTILIISEKDENTPSIANDISENVGYFENKGIINNENKRDETPSIANNIPQNNENKRDETPSIANNIPQNNENRRDETPSIANNISKNNENDSKVNNDSTNVNKKIEWEGYKREDHTSYLTKGKQSNGSNVQENISEPLNSPKSSNLTINHNKSDLNLKYGVEQVSQNNNLEEVSQNNNLEELSQKDSGNEVISNNETIKKQNNESITGYETITQIYGEISKANNKALKDFMNNKLTYNLNLRKGVLIKHDFSMSSNDNDVVKNNEIGFSDSMLKNLLENDEIDINTLESENDEFLNKVFEKTKDKEVMNVIVKTYLNEYQFIKAKKFIENLPSMYLEGLDPLLNLQVSFNSFPLSSKTFIESLNSQVQNYYNKKQITIEERNWYMGILYLMQQNYDKFFELSNQFITPKYREFADKLQGYKTQISKQMGMPRYYFDTLVALELFNQGFFQPAKVLALHSLQQDSKYILPYQVLAYANFLTNSWDTSIEYLKKLIDLDPNNAEKYRFLMGIAYYRDENYEQSVIMLSMIKNDKLYLDTQRYLINNYLKLDQKNKLVSSWNKMLGLENLVASDFYNYFYEAFFLPYSQGSQFEIYMYDNELANKMIRVCTMRLPDEEKVICTYGSIGRNIALGEFEGLEQYLLQLISEYPQGYLYQALGEYYVKQGNLDKAKVYLLKAVSLSQSTAEVNQIKKLLEGAI